MAASSILWPQPGPRFYAAPPNAAQRRSTFANPQTLRSCPRPENHHGFQTFANPQMLYVFAVLWPFYAVANLQRSFTPSSICIRLSGSSPACEG